MIKVFGAVFLIFWCESLIAQSGIITGIVTESSTGEPLHSVNVFLSNATKGTQTNMDGAFSLTNIKAGQYDLVVSCIGFRTFSQRVTVNNNLQNISIQLEKKVVELKEVVIGKDPDWARNYQVFKRVFIGSTENAPLCTIVNPKAVHLYFDKEVKRLEASSDEFLIVENRGLGYRLKYLIKEFEWTSKTGMLYYSGQVLFEDLKGSNAQVKRWQKNRLHTYLGSNMHFLRSIKANRLLENGFLVRATILKVFEGRPSDSLILSKIKMIKAHVTLTGLDSLEYWNKLYRSPKSIRILGKDTLKASDIARLTNVSHLYALNYKTDLHVIYTKKITGFSRNDKSQTAIVSFQHPPALFDSNGIVVNARSVIYEGAWSQGVAELLPNDYEPPVE